MFKSVVANMKCESDTPQWDKLIIEKGDLEIHIPRSMMCNSNGKPYKDVQALLNRSCNEGFTKELAAALKSKGIDIYVIPKVGVANA